MGYHTVVIIMLFPLADSTYATYLSDYSIAHHNIYMLREPFDIPRGLYAPFLNSFSYAHLVKCTDCVSTHLFTRSAVHIVTGAHTHAANAIPIP